MLGAVAHMKCGVVKFSRIRSTPGHILSAERYLDHCANCGKQQNDPKFHQDGKCGQYKRVFVPSGTNWEDGNVPKQ